MSMPELWLNEEEEVKKVVKKVVQVKKLAKYKCLVCGRTYDPETGDPEHGINPGVPFEKLPEGWCCPLCGVPKDRFIVVEY